MSQSVRRAARIIDTIMTAPQTVAQLAATFDLHRSTMFRELKALEEVGFARRRSDGTYAVGMHLVTVAGAALEQIDLRAAAADHVRALHAHTGDTVHVAALLGNSIVYVDKVEDVSGVRMYSRVGAPVPPQCSAVGKAILASLPEYERAHILAGIDWQSYTPATITDRPTLDIELDRIASQGWASDDGEFEDFVTCLAVPIHSSAGVLGGLSVTAIRMARDLEQLRTHLPRMQRTAAAISRALE